MKVKYKTVTVVLKHSPYMGYTKTVRGANKWVLVSIPQTGKELSRQQEWRDQIDEMLIKQGADPMDVLNAGWLFD